MGHFNEIFKPVKPLKGFNCPRSHASKRALIQVEETLNIIIIIIIIIIFLHGLGHLTYSSIDALPSFPGTSTISSTSRFIVEGVFRESGTFHYFKMVDPVFFVSESHVLYSRDL